MAISTPKKTRSLAVPVNGAFLEFAKAELEKHGVKTSRDRQAFYRGAIVSAITNVKRAKSPAWKRFIAAIQPIARKHLGMGLDLEGPRGVIKAGQI